MSLIGGIFCVSHWERFFKIFLKIILIVIYLEVKLWKCTVILYVSIMPTLKKTENDTFWQGFGNI